MKKVKLIDVATEAGVSLTTVSRVINQNGYVSEEVQSAVEKAIKKTGYIIPKAKETQKEQKDTLVGLILRRTSSNLFFDTLNTALLQAVEKEGLQAVTLFSDRLKSEDLKEKAEKLLDYRVCGIVICGFGEAKLASPVRRFLKSCGIPVVFVERPADNNGFDQICVDNQLGGYLAAQHLVKRGNKRILYIGRNLRDTEVESARLSGFLRAIREAEETPEYLIKLCDDNSVEAGYRAMQEAEQEFPGITGIQTWFDGYAAGALQYLYQIGRRVPDEVEVIGYDDTYAPYLAPPISSVRMPYDEIAQSAIDVILKWQDSSVEHFVRTVYLEPKLILREGNAEKEN